MEMETGVRWSTFLGSKNTSVSGTSGGKKHNFEEADLTNRRSKKASVLAHNAQTELLVAEANGEKLEISVLLIHSQVIWWQVC